MKKLLTIILALAPVLAFSQIKYDSVRVVKPQNFVEALSIDTAIVQIISQKAGVNRRVNFQTVADWILAQQPNLDSAQYANDTLLLFYGPDTILAVIPSGTIDTAYLSGDTLGIIFAGDTTEVVLVGLGDGNGIFDATNDGDTTAIGSVVLGEDLTVELNNHDWLFDGLVEDDTTSRIMTLRGDGSLAYRWLDSLLNGYTTGSGTPGTLPIWTGANALGNSSLTEASGVLSSSLTGAFKLPAGTDAQDPVWTAGMLRYNTTANGIQGYDGTAERFLPWANADNWAANQIPYSNGSALTSESDFAYNGSELSINMTDQGAYNLQARGPVLFSNDGTASTGFIFTPSDRKITSAVANAGIVIEGSGGNSFTTIYGKSSINLRVDDNTDNDVINIQNGSGNTYGQYSPRLHFFKVGQENSTAAFTLKAHNNGNLSGKNLIIEGGQSISASGPFNGGKLVLRGGSGSVGHSPTSLPGNVEIGRYAVGGTLAYTALSEWKLDTIYHYKYGKGAITGTHAYSASFNSSGKLIEVPEKWAFISTSTDGSGDIVVAHGMGVTPTSIQVTITGTTPYVVTVHTIGSTNFTVRFFDMTGAAVASTAVTATWHAKT